MRTILVVNPKGGCGKSTIATNLAGYYASKGRSVALVDLDQQRSSYQWGATRSPQAAKIDVYQEDLGEQELNASRVIYDCPAQIHIGSTTDLINKSDVIIMPINPSIIDHRAAFKFIFDIRGMVRANVCKSIQIGFVANRASDKFKSFEELEKFSKLMKVPLITSLRSSQNYVRAAGDSTSIFEMPPNKVSRDIEQWRALCYWAEGKLLRKKVS